MSNINENRVNITMTAAQITAVKAAIITIQTNMPFLIGLTVDERITRPKINVNNKAFTEDAINAAVNNASMIPAYFSTANMLTDLNLFEQLDELLLVINQLVEKIDDTHMLAGSEAFVSALASYRLFEAAATAGVPGADTIFAQLKARFQNQGPATPPPPTP